jgi:hypothetical protein
VTHACRTSRAGTAPRAPDHAIRHTGPAMIVNDFIIMKDFRAYGTNFLRQEKSFRDHGGELGWAL